MRQTSWAGAALLLTAASLGCSHAHTTAPVRPAAAGDDGPQPRFFPAPFALAQPEDAIVRIVGPQMNCSGTLVEDDLVLTAHHCVVARDAAGRFTDESLAPESIRIELGGDYLAWGHVGVAHVVAPPCGEAGGAGDIAVLVLERKLVGLATMTPRLEGPPKLGEVLDPVGFGRCAMSGDGIHRRLRDGGPVRAMTGLTFDLQASICPGDSGGPVLARGGHEVVGVVSLSAMDGDDRTRGISIMTRLDAFRAVFRNARQIADGTPASELPPLACEP